MTVTSAAGRPELYWISGSPPCWRVMLALALKGIDHASRLLEAARGEHKAPSYLALNPRGQVPTLRDGSVVVRESIAILAYLDARWPERPIFGAGPADTAAIWQEVMDFESNLHPAFTTIARVLFRGESSNRRDELSVATATAAAELEGLEGKLAERPFLAGDRPTAADCVLYPAIGWVRRAIDKTAPVVTLPPAVPALLEDHPALAAWCARIEALPGFTSTYPPHWREHNRIVT